MAKNFTIWKEVINMAKNLGLHNSKLWLKSRRDQGKTMKEMSDEAGVSVEIISRSLKKFGIK